jgi:hypothetical protein
MGFHRNFIARTGAAAIVLAAWGVACSTDADAAAIAYVNSGGFTINYVAGAGHTVTYLNNPVGLTAAALGSFDAVIATSNSTFLDPSGVGNALQGYADAGGRVVVTQFSFDPNWGLAGGITAAGYLPFTAGPEGDSYQSGGLGTIHLPGHPLLDGALLATTTFQHNAGVDPGATLVASWASGRPAVGYNEISGGGIVIGLNLFPADGFVSPGGERLVLNALGFGGGWAVSTPEPGTMALFGLGLAALLTARGRVASKA